MTAVVSGTVDPAFGSVGDAFADSLARTDGTGASLAVRVDGRWVVDLWGGHADAARTRPWTQDTLVMPYSVTKPFAAVCVLLLVDRGLLDLDAPVSDTWPGLRGGATVAQLLAHTSGHVLLEDPAPGEVLLDPVALSRRLADQEPRFAPGSRPAEAALVYGSLLDPLVRAVDGRSLGTFLREEVCGPLGLDFHLGLRPDELARAADLTGLDGLRAAQADREGLMGAALANPPGALDPALVLGDAFRRAEVGAINGHGTARAVAGLYVALAEGGLLSAALLAAMQDVVVEGTDLVTGSPTRWGLGVQVEPDGFGMGGTGGALGWCSTAGGYTYAYLPGHLGDDDSDRLENAVRTVLGLDPL